MEVQDDDLFMQLSLLQEEDLIDNQKKQKNNLQENQNLKDEFKSEAEIQLQQHPLFKNLKLPQKVSVIKNNYNQNLRNNNQLLQNQEFLANKEKFILEKILPLIQNFLQENIWTWKNEGKKQQNKKIIDLNNNQIDFSFPQSIFVGDFPVIKYQEPTYEVEQLQVKALNNDQLEMIKQKGEFIVPSKKFKIPYIWRLCNSLIFGQYYIKEEFRSNMSNIVELCMKFMQPNKQQLKNSIKEVFYNFPMLIIDTLIGAPRKQLCQIQFQNLEQQKIQQFFQKIEYFKNKDLIDQISKIENFQQDRFFIDKCLDLKLQNYLKAYPEKIEIIANLVTFFRENKISEKIILKKQELEENKYKEIQGFNTFLLDLYDDYFDEDSDDYLSVDIRQNIAEQLNLNLIFAYEIEKFIKEYEIFQQRMKSQLQNNYPCLSKCKNWVLIKYEQETQVFFEEQLQLIQNNIEISLSNVQNSQNRFKTAFQYNSQFFLNNKNDQIKKQIQQTLQELQKEIQLSKENQIKVYQNTNILQYSWNMKYIQGKFIKKLQDQDNQQPKQILQQIFSEQITVDQNKYGWRFIVIYKAIVAMYKILLQDTYYTLTISPVNLVNSFSGKDFYHTTFIVQYQNQIKGLQQQYTIKSKWKQMLQRQNDEIQQIAEQPDTALYSRKEKLENAKSQHKRNKIQFVLFEIILSFLVFFLINLGVIVFFIIAFLTLPFFVIIFQLVVRPLLYQENGYDFIQQRETKITIVPIFHHIFYNLLFKGVFSALYYLFFRRILIILTVLCLFCIYWIKYLYLLLIDFCKFRNNIKNKARIPVTEDQYAIRIKGPGIGKNSKILTLEDEDVYILIQAKMEKIILEYQFNQINHILDDPLIQAKNIYSRLFQNIGLVKQDQFNDVQKGVTKIKQILHQKYSQRINKLPGIQSSNIRFTEEELDRLVPITNEIIYGFVQDYKLDFIWTKYQVNVNEYQILTEKIWQDMFLNKNILIGIDNEIEQQNQRHGIQKEQSQGFQKVLKNIQQNIQNKEQIQKKWKRFQKQNQNRNYNNQQVNLSEQQKKLQFEQQINYNFRKPINSDIFQIYSQSINNTLFKNIIIDINQDSSNIDQLLKKYFFSQLSQGIFKKNQSLQQISQQQTAKISLDNLLNYVLKTAQLSMLDMLDQQTILFLKQNNLPQEFLPGLNLTLNGVELAKFKIKNKNK